MSDTRVKINSIVQDQLPDFVQEEYPLIGEFLKEYYNSIENPGGTLDILQNIDKYLKIDEIYQSITNRSITVKPTSPQTYFVVEGGYSIEDLIVFKNGIKLLNNVDYFASDGFSVILSAAATPEDVLEFVSQSPSTTYLTSEVGFVDDTINVLSTYGFPEKNGLIQIDSEIILYSTKDETTFNGCKRGFSGITTYRSTNQPDQLTFSTSEISDHSTNTKVLNLSSLFLKEFVLKLKKQYIPGFENKTFADGVNEKNFIKQSKDFYNSKGTDASYELLFKALFGEEVKVIKPRDFLLRPSDSQYRVTKDLVVEIISGDPEKLENKTLYQDKTNFYQKAYATITKVEKIVRQNKTYYTLSLDYDYDKDINVSGSVYGNFPIHPSTKCLSEIGLTNYSIIVDSTIGFPSYGELIFNIDGTDYTISYSYKNTTEFFISSPPTVTIPKGTDIKLNAYSYAFDGDSLIKVRITGVLSDISFEQSNYLMYSGNKIKTVSLGYKAKRNISNRWVFNVANTYSVKEISDPTSSNLELNIFSYKVTTYDPHNLLISDSLELLFANRSKLPGTYKVLSVDNEYSFKIEGPKIENVNLRFLVQRIVKKPKFKNYPLLNNTIANVQNVYIKNDSENEVYVTSNCLPNYLDEEIEIKSPSIAFSGTFNGEIIDLSSGNPNNLHGFYTGDTVVLSSGFSETGNTLNIQNKVYYVKKVDSTKIKLSNSREDLFNNKFITITGSTDNSILTKLKFENNSLSLQSYVKNIKIPTNSGKNQETPVGPVGVLVNGVEAYNYKSSDKVYYGGITSIKVLEGGDKYNVISPPTIVIEDSKGINASAFAQVEGSLEKINVIDGGFDYVEDPIVSITGGNGIGVDVKPNLVAFKHAVYFNATSSSGFVDLSNNTIGFSSYHKFRDLERVVYFTQGQTSVGGLTTDAQYYVGVQDAYKVKLYNTSNDANLGINTINLSSYGSGVHGFESVDLKKKITSISIVNSGSGYSNKKTICSPENINIVSNTINISNHGYRSGEIIVYTNNGTSIGGLTNNNSYYVTKLNDNQFKLSNVGVGSTNKDFFYKTNQFVDFTSIGSSDHSFNYPDIVVSIKGKIGVSTLSGQDYNAIVQPIFSGKIIGVVVKNSGVGYGSSEIINYERQPKISLKIGSGAQVSPIVSNGKITDVLVLNGGSDYIAPPVINVSGVGTGAVLTPVVSNGKLTEVKIINGGVGFGTVGTSLDVTTLGSGFKSECKIKSWTINNVEKYLLDRQILDDDGLIEVSSFTNVGSQYCHFYAPRKLRRSLFGIDYVDGKKTYVSDLKLSGNREIVSTVHSPIIGWAYDGNPIYGPYGYASPDGSGRVREMVPGYILQISNDRPNPISESGESLYPEGFFVEDYSFNNSGDLDSHNGRFCITPEYPNGIYAYFSTINNLSTETDGVFKNYKKPVFPYLIGNTFKSDTIEFNYNKTINQSNFNFIENELIRNTSPYSMSSNASDYDFVFNPIKVKEPVTQIRSSSLGYLSDIGISTGGSGYKVGDIVDFDDEDSNGFDAYAKVSYLKGKIVNSISFASTSFENIEFYQYNSNGRFIGFCTIPHSLSNNDIVTITGLSTFSNFFDGFFNVGIKSDTLTLANSVPNSTTTGIITYFNVNGVLQFPNIRENDVYKLNDEKIKILSIDKSAYRIKVLREYDSTIGSSHTASTVLYEQTRKFTINLNKKVNQSYKINREIYFNPQETLSIGSSSGVGIGSTLYFSNPGVGITNIFIPTKTLYLPNHSLQTGDELVYSSNGGVPFYVSNDGSSIFQLQEDQSLYVAKISDDLIGISTNKVGLGSTGSFVGINSSIFSSTLYLNNIGSGENHSFKTNYDEILIGELSKNIVTVSTASTHGLSKNDLIEVDCFPGISTTIIVKYNDKHRRLVVNPKSFTAFDVDIVKNTIFIENHGYFTGQKIIYTSSSPIGGLSNDEIYYIVRFNKNKFKLSASYYNATKNNPEIIDFTSASSGTISLINPNIDIVPNQIVNFDLSDSSLSFVKDLNLYSAFDLKFYTDSKFTDEFYKVENSNEFNVKKVGKIGVDSFAKVTLSTFNLPGGLYYNLVPVDLSNNSQTKKEIITDSENVVKNNQLSLIRSLYSGVYKLSGVGQTTFTYNVLNSPENPSYNNENSSIQYYTNSKTANGEIYEIDLQSGGKNYDTLPGITSVVSTNGRGAILKARTTNIGKIKKVDIDDIGFEYPSDLTLRPSAKLPQLLHISPLSVFSYIGVSSVGKNYTISPDLVVIDSYTNKVISDVDLKYNVNTKEVDILKNTNGIFNVSPKIIPINNSNGIRINDITFDDVTKDVTIELGVSFSYGQTFPFEVGDKILVENISVLSPTSLTSSPKGYNSKNYNYSLFTVKSVDPQYGGFGATIVYNLSNYLSGSEYPGTFDSENSAGIVVPEKYFPIFDPVLEKGNFLYGEKVRSDSSDVYGNVIYWNSYSEQLKVSTTQSFAINTFIIGETTGSKGFVTQVDDINAFYSVNSSSIVKKGWKRETGFLNNQFQVTSDNNYYQYFSYSIQSKVDYETWNENIGNMNHTAGFKKFSDVLVESSDVSFSGISTSQDEGSFIGISDLIGEIDLNCVYDFDLAKEKTIKINSEDVSKEIIFNSVSIQDEFQAIGNRVLEIDDISGQFSNTPNVNNYSNVETFFISDFQSKKYVTFVRDKRFTGVRQVSLVSLLQDGLEGYMNQYAKVETVDDLGNFDFSIFGTQGTLRFYPINNTINDYDISYFSYGLGDSTLGVGNTSIGNISRIQSSTLTIPAGTSTQTNIVGIASTYRASKILVQVSASNGSYYEFNELTIIHNNSTANIVEYGQLLNSNRIQYSPEGIGTYSANISGSLVYLNFTPNVGLGTTYVVNALAVSVASTTGTTPNSLVFDTTEVKSNYVSIAASTSPTENEISSYGLSYSGSYCFVVIEDSANNSYQASEIVIVSENGSGNAEFIEFGTVSTNVGLGTFGVGVGTTGTNLYFTPNENIQVDVRVYQNSIGIIDAFNTLNYYDLTNANLKSGASEYQGLLNSIKKSFDLYHQQIPVFQRTINAENSSIIDIQNNTIRVPKHFFVTGEEIVYDPGDGDRIGIATTSIAGIGTTDKLPSSVFAIKVSDLDIKLADSAENALKSTPIPLTLTTVGIGSLHTFTSKNQNTKCLISLDNYIQSPIVSTSTTTILSQTLLSNEITLTLAGITSIFGGDLLKIDNEIVKVNTVGFASTNVLLVDRGWMGTNPDNHSSLSLVTKINGNYNIVDNTIHFVEAPYGRSPIGTITNRPDERDYTGITTRSTFSGRVFIRSGIENSSNETYSKNYIFDGISDQFTGLTTSFTLRSSGQDISGISSGCFVLINSIFQEPQRLGVVNIAGDYKINESVGITTLSFTGNISSTSYDVNTSSIPRGGVIVSVGSTQGFGYQPLISAGGTSVVSTSGTISSISVGYTGSGYRSLSKYEIITETSTSISIGSTIIPINNTEGVFGKLNFSSYNTIGIGSIFVDVPIVSVGNTFVTIGAGYTSNKSIDASTSVTVTLNSPTVGLVNVGVKTYSTGVLNYEFIGFTTISSGRVSNNVIITNPGSGYTSSNPPIVVFDSPQSYSNIPLIYSSGYSGIGTSATIDIVVGQGSSVIDFKINNLGYAYKVSEKLTVPTGGLTGIPTDLTKPFINFELTVDETFFDLFAGWSVGDLQVIDKIEGLFNGTRRTFPIKIDGVQTSFRAKPGSNINIRSNLLIFINDVLQIPGSSYIFNGGSIITFVEAPKEGDTCKILFYKGTESVDVIFTDILETIKIGDNVRLNSDLLLQKEDERLVSDIISSDTIETNPYSGPGVSLDETLLRPLIWCRQTEDKIIDGKEVGKDRILYEASIQPSTNIIQNVSVGSTEIFVESAKIFFDDLRENATNSFKSKILITSQDNIIAAAGTAIVSSAGTISSISLSNPGFGFTSSPSISISSPGIGTTATAFSSISSGIITSIAISNPGSGYTSSNPPQVLIEQPHLITEKVEDVTYEGDFGTIVGVKTTTVGVGSTAIVFDLFVPTNSYLRNSNINVGIATTGISGIKTGYYFTVFNSNIGFGITSVNSDSSIIGIGTTCLDNVYNVHSVSIAQTSVPGVGITNVSRVITRVRNYNGLVGTGFSNFYGEYSWGKINVLTRKNSKSFNSYRSNGITGLSTSAIVQRINPLKYVGYSTSLQQ